jgi:hypothetical protein
MIRGARLAQPTEFEVIGWILWDEQEDAPFQRLGPQQWTGRQPVRPTVIYTEGRAKSMARTHKCGIRPVYLGTE